MGELNLPKTTREGLAKLASLPDKHFQEFLAVVSRPPTVIRRRLFSATIAASLPLFERNDVELIVDSVMYLLSFRQSQTAFQQFVEDVIAELRDETGEPFTISASLADILKGRLLVILRLEPLRIRSKAAGLVFEGAQVFQSARIITDFRPVFGGESTLDIVGGIIVHNLKIEYFTIDGGGEVYISMDDEDIAQIKDVLNRAENKARVLRKHLKNSQIVDLNPGDDNENA